MNETPDSEYHRHEDEVLLGQFDQVAKSEIAKFRKGEITREELMRILVAEIETTVGGL